MVSWAVEPGSSASDRLTARPPRRELEASVARPSYVLFGDVELLGWTPPDAARAYGPGEALPVTLLWQARAAGGPPEGARHALFWLEGTERIALGGAPLGGDFKADAWVAGQVVRQWPVLSVPAGTPAGSYRLTMRVLRDAQPVPWGRWLLPLGTDLTLGTVDIID